MHIIHVIQGIMWAPVTMECCVPGLQMEEPASKDGV
jgi:hypothetical protein